MLERLAFVLIWIVISLFALWLFLRFVPNIIRFFRYEIRVAKTRSMEETPMEKTEPTAPPPALPVDPKPKQAARTAGSKSKKGRK